jgi:hypothetical protein
LSSTSSFLGIDFHTKAILLRQKAKGQQSAKLRGWIDKRTAGVVGHLDQD